MYDRTGKMIKVGDMVLFRERVYTIRNFLPGMGRAGIACIEFVEQDRHDAHTDEVPDEWLVDLVKYG